MYMPQMSKLPFLLVSIMIIMFFFFWGLKSYFNIKMELKSSGDNINNISKKNKWPLK